MQIANRMVEQAELARTLPATGNQGFAPGDQVARQGQEQCDHMLRHCMFGVAANVGHDDTACLCSYQIDVVGDGYRCPLQTLDHLRRCRCRVFDPFVGKSWPPHGGDQRLAFELDDTHDQAACSSKALPAAAAMAPTCAPSAALPQNTRRSMAPPHSPSMAATSPCSRLTTPAGHFSRLVSSHRAKTADGAFGLGLTATVAPARTAGAMLCAKPASGRSASSTRPMTPVSPTVEPRKAAT